MVQHKKLKSFLGLEHLEDRSTPTTFTVTNANDSGPGSLRAELALATADGTPDTIDFAPSIAGATIPLSTVGDTLDGPSAFRIVTPITIEGSGQTITRLNTSPAMRFFTVGTTGKLTLQNMTFSDGLAV